MIISISTFFTFSENIHSGVGRIFGRGVLGSTRACARTVRMSAAPRGNNDT